MYKKNLIKLRKALPKGYAEIIGKKTGFSAASVYKTLSGEIVNTVILDAAIEIAVALQRQNKERIEQIESLKNYL